MTTPAKARLISYSGVLSSYIMSINQGAWQVGAVTLTIAKGFVNAKYTAEIQSVATYTASNVMQSRKCRNDVYVL